MRALSWPVIVGTIVVGSPAVYAVQVADTLSPDVALLRLVACALGVWAICSVVASLVGMAVTANDAADNAAAAPVEAPDMQRPAGVDS